MSTNKVNCIYNIVHVKIVGIRRNVIGRDEVSSALTLSFYVTMTTEKLVDINHFLLVCNELNCFKLNYRFVGQTPFKLSK